MDKFKKLHLRIILINLTFSFLIISPQLIIEADFEHLILVLPFLLILLSFSILNRIIFYILAIYSSLINFIMFHLYIHWGNGSFSDVLEREEVVFLSPKNEMIEYLNCYISFQDYIFVILLLIILFYSFKYTKVIPFKKNKKYLLFTINIIIMLATRSYPPLNIAKKNLKNNLRFGEMSSIIRNRTKTKSSIKQVKYNKGLYDKIIYIQGESANKKHLSIYGYNKNTTPFLKKLKDNNKLYIFNAISPTNQTRYSIPIFFTDANVTNWKNGFIHSFSILEDFIFANYSTYWISNQGEIGYHDSYISTIAKESNNPIFLNSYKSDGLKIDEEVVKTVKNIELKIKSFIVLHLMGSHFEYTKRYPQNHVLIKNPKTIEEEYDNTIYYTDSIIEKVFHYFSKNNEKILLIYISDHGEVVNPKKQGHGFCYPPYKDEYEVPFVIYSSIKNKRIDRIYKYNQKNTINLENLNYIIKYISGISNRFEISNSNTVLGINPQNLFEYDKLMYYK